MNETEKHVMAWVPSMWEPANKFGDYESWNALCEALYGAAHACNQTNALDDYEAYSLLVAVARERSFNSFTAKYQEAS